jgi:molecular chaperone GrpE
MVHMNKGKKIIRTKTDETEPELPSALDRGLEHAAEVEKDILLKRVGELEAEIGSLKDELMREQAKFQNLRRRGDEEKAEIRKFGTFDLAFDLLNVLDCFEMGLECSTEGVEEALKPYVQGVQFTIEEMNKVLGRLGIKEIPTDIPYDPELHQVFECVEVRGREDGEIIEVKRKGYMIHDRVLRNALVSVAGSPDECAANEEAGEAE